MALERQRQKARLSILEKMREGGAPGAPSLSPFPDPTTEEPVEDETMQDYSNSMDQLSSPTAMQERLRRKKKLQGSEPA
jgi:hypothetical protein